MPFFQNVYKFANIDFKTFVILTYINLFYLTHIKTFRKRQQRNSSNLELLL